jgi:hypothetical protein
MKEKTLFGAFTFCRLLNHFPLCCDLLEVFLTFDESTEQKAGWELKRLTVD